MKPYHDPARDPAAEQGKQAIRQPDAVACRIGDRLRRARIMSGHSLRSLAERLGGEVSHTQIRNFESGEACPDSRMLGLFAKTLGVRPDYFFKGDELKLVAVEYRKQTKLGTRPRQRLEEQAFEFFERYLEIERILGIKPQALPQRDLTDTADADLPDAIEGAAEQLRRHWKLGMNPIPNIHATLEHHGVKVKVLPHQDGFDGFSAFAEADGIRVPVMALSDETAKDLPRLRFTAVHELAHLYLRLPERLGPKEVERCCHRFGGAFLIPRSPFEETFGPNRVRIAVAELCAIKAEWGLSLAAIMKRALNLGLITEGRHKSFCIVSNKNHWRSKEPGRWAGTESSGRFEQLVQRALAEELITSSKAAGLLGVSLPELSAKFDLVG